MPDPAILFQKLPEAKALAAIRGIIKGERDRAKHGLPPCYLNPRLGEMFEVGLFDGPCKRYFDVVADRADAQEGE